MSECRHCFHSMVERHAMVEQHDCRMCCLCIHQECFDVGVWIDRRPNCKVVVAIFDGRDCYYHRVRN